MKCSDIQKLFSAFQDEELEAKESQRVREHLKDCSDCRKELEFYKKSWDLLGIWKDKEPAPGYIGRFWSRLAQEKTWGEQALESIREILTKRALAPVFAAIFIFIIVGSFSYRYYVSGQKSEKALAVMTPEEIELVDQLELAQNYDVIVNMDVVEDLEVVENLDSIQS